ncbi:hypothetical protein FRC20_006980 [Serendipita sp. 405]|nr:hypothetical protein FRC20_006980 [Serendipita sp. 405]
MRPMTFSVKVIAATPITAYRQEFAKAQRSDASSDYNEAIIQKSSFSIICVSKQVNLSPLFFDQRRTTTEGSPARRHSSLGRFFAVGSPMMALICPKVLSVRCLKDGRWRSLFASL